MKWEYFKGKNFHELVEKKDFAEKTSVHCMLILPTVHHAFKQSLESFHGQAQDTFTKVFSLESFLLYEIMMMSHRKIL